jgi:hypothetical protein
VTGEIQVEAAGRFLRRFERRDGAEIGGPKRLGPHALRRGAAEDCLGERATEAIPRTDEDDVEPVIPLLS